MQAQITYLTYSTYCPADDKLQAAFGQAAADLPHFRATDNIGPILPICSVSPPEQDADAAWIVRGP
jgi:hypothetical protein